jgi:hypothetical protein
MEKYLECIQNMETYSEMKSSPEKPNTHNVSSRILYDTEHAQGVHIELKSEEALKKHHTRGCVFLCS